MIRRATSHPDPLPDLPPSPRSRRKSEKPAVHLIESSFTRAECGVIPAGFSEMTQTQDAVTCGNCRRILERRRKLAARRERRP